LHDIELARISQGRANQFFGRVIRQPARFCGGKSRPAAWERRVGRLGCILRNGGRLIDNPSMNKLHYQRADYSVVVKNRAPPPKAWRWEIYRAGNVNPIKQSSIYFETTAAARRAGKDALKELLNKLFA
jgi:hypothetical protein